MDGHINTVSKSSVHQMENYSDYNDSGTIKHQQPFHSQTYFPHGTKNTTYTN